MTSFTCFDHFGTVLEQVPEEYRGDLASAIILYGTKGIEPELDWQLMGMFEGLRNDIDNSVNAKNKNRGGRPKKTGDTEEENGGFANSETHVSETENPCSEKSKPKLSQSKLSQTKLDKENRRANRAKFSPPSLSEVNQFWMDENLRGSPEAFFDYFTAQGWKLSNGNAMKDWKAAARNWSRRQDKWEGGQGVSDYVERTVGDVAF